MNIIKNKLLILLILLLILILFLLNIHYKSENFINYKITDFHKKKYSMKLPKHYYKNLDINYKKYIKLNKEYKTENELDNINLKSYNRNQKILPYNSIFNESDDYRIKIKNYNIYNKPLGFKCQRNYNDCTQLYLLK